MRKKLSQHSFIVTHNLVKLKTQPVYELRIIKNSKSFIDILNSVTRCVLRIALLFCTRMLWEGDPISTPSNRPRRVGRARKRETRLGSLRVAPKSVCIRERERERQRERERERERGGGGNARATARQPPSYTDARVYERYGQRSGSVDEWERERERECESYGTAACELH